MDKYEFKLRAGEIRTLISEKKFKEAVEIADTIDWRNVKNGMTLCTISDLYKMCRRYEDARDVLLLAYQRNPGGRMILYSLCELSIKLNDVVNAIEYYKEYLQVASRDTGRYILQYKIYEAQEASLEERISILEELQKRECKEKWMYELAYLYHRVGLGTSCVEECNQIVLFFGEGKYVIKALELKALHEPLSGEQDELYKRLTGTGDPDIQVRDMNMSQFNTIDLQKELANSLKEVMYDDTTSVLPTKEAVASIEKETEGELKSAVEEQVKAEEIPEIPVELPIEIMDSDFSEVKVEEAAKPEASQEEKEPEAKPFIIHENVPANDTTKLDNSQVDIDKMPTQVIGQMTFIDEDTVAINDTLVYKKSEIEAALGGSKIENHYGMYGSNFDDMITMEGDGQISLVVPDEPMVEKQITGQISIDEVLMEYERKKKESEKQWSLSVRNRILKQTDNLLRSFDESSREGLLEELENHIDSLPDPEPSEAEQYEGEILPVEEKYAHNDSMEEIFYEEVVEEVTEEAEEIETVDNEKPVEVVEEVEEEGPTSEELSFDRTPYLEKEIETKPEEITNHSPEPSVEDNTTNLPSQEDLDYFMAFAAASEEKDREEAMAVAAFEKAMEEIAREEGVELSKPDSERSDILVEPVKEFETTEEPEVTIEQKIEEVTEVIEEVSVEPEEAEEIEPVEEAIEEVVEPEAIEAVEEETTTEEIEEAKEETTAEEIEAVEEETTAEEIEEAKEETTAEEIEEETTTEEIEEAEEETTAEEVEEAESETVEEPEAQKGVGRDCFTDEQWVRFESFVQTEFGREQVKTAIDGMSDYACRGNVIIGSPDVDSAIELGKALIIEQSHKGGISGKAAKIKASSLNAKDPEATLSKVYDGAIIIQDAEELRRETLDVMRRVLSSDEKKILVILTMSHRQKNRFIMENADMLESFTTSIDVDPLDNTHLVRLAKQYALMKEFSIDEMGTLALHTRIDERQTNAHAVMLSEVKEIVDEAIAHSTKKNVGHFFDVLVGKRYDENDMIILGEKDFIL